MAQGKPTDLTLRVAARWLLNHESPPQSRKPFSLPIGMVATLELGDQVEGMDGTAYEVTAVGPGALALTVGDETRIFTNQGYGAYSWAYYAAPHLHWLINR